MNCSFCVLVILLGLGALGDQSLVAGEGDPEGHQVRGPQYWQDPGAQLDASDGNQTAEPSRKTSKSLPGNDTNEVILTEKEEKFPSQESLERTSVEGWNVSNTSDGNQKVAQSETKTKSLPGNDTKEVILTKKEEKFPSQEGLQSIAVERWNVSSTSGGNQTGEQSEKNTKSLPGNDTKEAILTKKEEKFPSQESLQSIAVEGWNVSSTSGGNQTAEQSEKNTKSLPGNDTKEVILTKKEEKFPSQESLERTSVEGWNVSKTSDRNQKVEQSEKTSKRLPGNDTNEVILKEKEEKFPSQESLQRTSVERRNVTFQGDGNDIEKESVIQNEVEENVCNSNIKEVRDEKHLNETIEDLKHQVKKMKEIRKEKHLNETIEDLKHEVEDVKHMIKEENAMAEETNATRSPNVVRKSSAAAVIQDGKVGKEIVPVKVVEKSVPSVVAEKLPSVTTEEVVEAMPTTATKGKVPVVMTEKVVETLPTTVTEEKVSYEDTLENKAAPIEKGTETKLKFRIIVHKRIVRKKTVMIVPVMDKNENRGPSGKVWKK